MDEEQREQQHQLGIFLGVLVALVVSTWLSWVELQYVLFSSTAAGTITQAEEHQIRQRRRGMTRTVLRVDFNYPNDAGQVARGQQDLAVGSPWKTGDPATVQYLSGDRPHARLKGTGQTWPVLVLIGAIGFAAFSIWQMAREASQPFSTKRTARRSPKRD